MSESSLQQSNYPKVQKFFKNIGNLAVSGPQKGFLGYP
jgi:hypothetical protein